MRVLVTGANGLCGSAIREESQNSQHDFLFRTRKDCNLLNEYDVRKMIADAKPDVVIHTAAKVGGIGANLSYPADFFYENMKMNMNIIHHSYDLGVKKLLVFSSVCVFPDSLPYLKEDKMHDGPVYHANAAYGYAKRMVDVYIQALQQQYGVTNYCSIIPGNIFGKCFSSDTEVMTVDGIKYITDIKIGDKVFTLNPNTKNIEVSNVIATQKTKTNKWINFKSRHVDFKVTPEHKMYYATSTNFLKKEAHTLLNNKSQINFANGTFIQKNEEYPQCIDLSEYIDQDMDTTYKNGYVRDFRHSSSSLFPIFYTPEDFYEFVGWYVAEGSYSRIRDGQYQIRITQCKKNNLENVKTIESLLNRMGIPFGYNGKNFYFTSKMFINYIKANLGFKSDTKKLPDVCLDLNFPNKLRQIIFNSLMLGDGNKDFSRYNTVSNILSKQFRMLCFYLNQKTSKQKSSNCHRISLPIHEYNCVKSHSVTEEIANNEDAYCISVDTNNIILAGRNESLNWVGQCDNFNLKNSHIVPALIHKLYLAKINNSKFRIWGNGSSMREFIYVNDLAKVILKLVDMPEIPSRVIVSGKYEFSIKDIVDALVHISDFNGEVVYDTSKPNGQYRRPSDKTVFDSYFPNFEYTDIYDGLKYTWEWFAANYKDVRK